MRCPRLTSGQLLSDSLLTAIKVYRTEAAFVSLLQPRPETHTYKHLHRMFAQVAQQTMMQVQEP